MGLGVGRCFKREVIYVYLWLIHIVVWQKTTRYCTEIILQFKKVKHHLVIEKIIIKNTQKIFT